MADYTRETNPIWKPDSITVILPAMTNSLLEMADVTAESLVLDIASGAGTCAIAFARRAAKVYALDIKPDQVEVCRAEAEKAGLSNVEVLLQDTCNLPFADHSFDLITGTGALSNIDKPEQALAEAFRVLKPDGQLALGDFLVPAQAQEVWGVLSAFHYGSRRPYLDYAQVQDLLYDAGFQVVKYRPLRWIDPLALSMGKRDLPDVLKERYYQAVLDMDAATKQALRLHQRNGNWVVVHDCFALVATRFKGKPVWEYEDVFSEKLRRSV